MNILSSHFEKQSTSTWTHCFAQLVRTTHNWAHVWWRTCSCTFRLGTQSPTTGAQMSRHESFVVVLHFFPEEKHGFVLLAYLTSLNQCVSRMIWYSWPLYMTRVCGHGSKIQKLLTPFPGAINAFRFRFVKESRNTHVFFSFHFWSTITESLSCLSACAFSGMNSIKAERRWGDVNIRRCGCRDIRHSWLCFNDMLLERT